MKLICINNREIQYPTYVDNRLIIGKEYTVRETINKSEFYNVEGFERFGIYKHRFITIQKYRKLKLQKLNQI